MMLPNCFYFVRLFFRMGITGRLKPFRRPKQTTKAKPAESSAGFAFVGGGE
jgi:hypothetical protein